MKQDHPKSNPPASEVFKVAMKQIVAVPKAEIERREAEYQKQRALRKKMPVSGGSRADPA